MKKASSGFSLLEMLVVIGILGIVLALGVVGFGDRTRAAVREGQADFAQTLEKVRTLVRRYNYDYYLDLGVTGSSYKFVAKDQSGTTMTEIPTVQGDMPSGITIKQITNNNLLGRAMYQAPFARTSAPSFCFSIQSSNNLQGEVTIVGVTGKVIVYAPQPTSTCTN
jgi:type IV pilus assembly protein PilA